MNNKKNKKVNHPDWNEFIQAILDFTSARIEGEPLSLIIEKGLQVFFQFPGCESVSLYNLDTDTFTFSPTLALPESSLVSTSAIFDTLVEKGYVATALGTGSITFCSINNDDDEIDHIVLPVLSATGVYGIIVLTTTWNPGEIEQLIVGLAKIFSFHFGALLINNRLHRDFESVQSLLEQKISVRTQVIKQSKRELELILDSIMTGVLIFSAESGIIANANHAACDILHIQRDDLIGSYRSEYFTNETIAMLTDQEGSFSKTTSECEITTAEGVKFPALRTLTPITLSKRNFILESFIDISRRKLAENALRESERRFRTMFERAGIGMILNTRDGRIVEANQEFCRLLGYNQEELKFLNISELIHPNDLSNFQSEQDNPFVVENKSRFDKEKRFIHKNGDVVWGRVTATKLHSAGDSPVYTLRMVEDITDHKRNEDILYKQTNLLNGVADATGALLTITNLDFAIDSAIDSIGKSSEVDQVFIYQFIQIGDSASLLQKNFWSKHSTSKRTGFETLTEIELSDIFKELIELFKFEGTYTHLVSELSKSEKAYFQKRGIESLMLVPIHVREELWGVIGVADLTFKRVFTEAEEALIKTAGSGIGAAIQRDRSNRELISSKDRAEESNRLKSSLLANMSHEIRTPLTGILGFATFLKEEIEDEYHKDLIEHVIFSGQRLLSTLNSILTLSDLQSSNLEAALTKENLSLMVVEAGAKFQSMAADSNLQFDIYIEDEDVSVFVDKGLFHQVLDNLIDNAIKYTEQGGVLIYVEKGEIDGEQVGLVRVVDSGIGIDPLDIDKIFLEFRQVSEGYGRRFEGTGLGLTLTKKMLDLMSGTINVTSVVGKGSTFVITVPTKVSNPETLKYLQEEGSKRVFNKVKPAHPSERKALPEILLVEDNILNKKVVEIYLNKICKIDYAKTGLSAVKMAESTRYDAVLMDIHLGKNINGIETARLIRENPVYEDVPIIALTGYTLAGDREELLAKGFDYYLAKPFKEKDIVGLMEEIFLKLYQ